MPVSQSPLSSLQKQIPISNEAVLDLLAERLDCPRSSLAIVRGQTSRHKVLFIRGLKADTIQARLGI
jgi:uncharacterized protein YggU (UPF0235/DUF167 family)